VVAVVDDVQRRRWQAGEHRAQRLERAQRVARAGEEEHRRGDARQVGGAQLLRTAGRMERVAEEEQTFDRLAGGGEVRRHPPAHRLAADDQPSLQRRIVADGSSTAR
jgi:hypothetical protein